MAKRFTDTGKWDHAWFRKLTPAMKCAWIYVVDKCDHAGIWTADFEAMSFTIGFDFTETEFINTFQEKIKILDHDKFLIPSFIDFQYGALNPENRVHQSVISKLEKEGANKVLKSPLKGAKDKDKDKDKEKDKEYYAQILKIYEDLYPLKKGKTKGLAKLVRDIKSDSDLEDLRIAVSNYDADRKAEGYKFVKHFSTFAQEWQDWIEVAAPPQANGIVDLSDIFGKEA